MGSIDNFSRFVCRYIHTQELSLSGLLVNLDILVKKKKWCLHLCVLNNTSLYKNKNRFFKRWTCISALIRNIIKERSNTCLMKQCLSGHHIDSAWMTVITTQLQTESGRGPYDVITQCMGPQNSSWISYSSGNWGLSTAEVTNTAYSMHQELTERHSEMSVLFWDSVSLCSPGTYCGAQTSNDPPASASQRSKLLIWGTISSAIIFLIVQL